MSIRALHVVSDIDERFGGPSQSVPLLCHYLQDFGVTSVICYTKFLEHDRNGVLEASNIEVVPVHLTFSRRLYFSRDLQRVLRSVIAERNIDLLHIHSMWRYNALAAFRVARRMGIPHIVSPRSNLYAEALRRSALRKRMTRFLFVDKMLSTAEFIHATAESERIAVGAIYPQLSKVKVIPNGVELASEIPREEARRLLNISQDAKVVLFLSRIHRRKGLIDLVYSFADVVREHPDALLLIAGPTEDAQYLKEVKETLISLGIEGKCSFLGMLRGQSKVAAFSACDIFALPSFFENFGIAVAEALAASRPVITTTSTPWEMLACRNAGWVVGAGDRVGLTQALVEGLGSERDVLRTMGNNARQLAGEFSWPSVADAMASAYKSVLGVSR